MSLNAPPRAVSAMSDAEACTALIVFARPPVPGQVKTRLAAGIGPHRALEVYRRLLNQTMDLLLAWAGPRYLYHASSTMPLPYWPPMQCTHRLQQGTDLGARMQVAMAEVLADHVQALIIGTDCPGLSQDLVSEAARQLVCHDMVLGPAVDGGYYLLGIKKPAAVLFEDMPWSTDQVAALTLARAARLGYVCHQLPVLRDIDTEADLPM
jgi:rSAM/selenodomain-associated transferase 1